MSKVNGIPRKVVPDKKPLHYRLKAWSDQVLKNKSEHKVYTISNDLVNWDYGTVVTLMTCKLQ